MFKSKGTNRLIPLVGPFGSFAAFDAKDRDYVGVYPFALYKNFLEASKTLDVNKKEDSMAASMEGKRSIFTPPIGLKMRTIQF
ncbi:hypothetical protein ACFO25_13835 [Paenactinomyces guangxiensis]|uniref:Uncharacterized protein n=1 Tax=Paenactinomyces guangxiensis TaxID=1490290 RepID=A0A7W1WP67_9BACL|nr:hypothetical protein [Paenactinomyces guangxiensis]MBA4493524.1 hypothetical protein [Paenactinomyces guangxiensis]MBH8590615.1 hypothetical protein [Paenactinomyces guangxiensis]